MDASPLTLDDDLDEWFALQRTRVEPSTWDSYVTSLRAYVRPYLGQVPLASLTVRMLDPHDVRLLESGGRRGQRLARRTVGYAHSILSKAWDDAVLAGLLDENVALRGTVPRLDPAADRRPARVVVWIKEQVRRFLELSVDHELADLRRVALSTGMRRGELLVLRWQDADLTAPLVPSRVSDRWRFQWPGLQLPRIRLHGLRHTYATRCAKGAPIKVVSERLGHSTIAMAIDTYAHVLPAQDRDAATAIASALGCQRAVLRASPRG